MPRTQPEPQERVVRRKRLRGKAAQDVDDVTRLDAPQLLPPSVHALLASIEARIGVCAPTTDPPLPRCAVLEELLEIDAAGSLRQRVWALDRASSDLGW